MSEKVTPGDKAEHTSNPTDVALTQEQVEILDGGGVLLLEHAICEQSIRLWKRPQEDEIYGQ